MSQLKDFTAPHSRGRYFGIIVCATCANAAGGMLASLASGAPDPVPLYVGGASGLLTLGNGLLLYVHSVAQEQRAYWDYRAEVERRFAPPEPEPEPLPQSVPPKNGNFYMDGADKIMRVGWGKKPPPYQTTTQYIGSLIIHEAAQGESYAIVDVNRGMWQIAQSGRPLDDLRESVWTGAGRPFGQTEWRQFRDAMISANLAAWNARGHKAGWHFTRRTVRVIESMRASRTPAPSYPVRLG